MISYTAIVFTVLLMSGCTTIGYAYFNYTFYEKNDEGYTILTARIRIVNDGYAKGVDTHPIWWHLVIDAVKYSFYMYEYIPAVIVQGEEETFSIMFRVPDIVAAGNRSIYYDKSGDLAYVLYNASLTIK